MSGRIISLMLLAGMANHVAAQDRRADDRQDALNQIIELVSESLETENLDFTTMLEDLNYYYVYPLDLNRATRTELQRLWVLDAFQMESLLTHIHTSGKLIDIHELQGINGFDLNTIHALEPFVQAGSGYRKPDLSWNSIKRESTNEVFVRYQRVVEEMEGYSAIDDSTLTAKPSSRYVGDPPRIFIRYRFRYMNHISAGITGEKDAGEEFFAGTQPRGFDFYSAHAYFGDYGVLKHAVVGDYQLEFGQGLTYWTGLAFGKSANITAIKRTAREITPYVSADENNFMRGAATTLRFGKVEWTTFYSNKKVDANITATAVDTTETGDEIGRNTEFSAFQTSGYHRTISELDDKNALGELNTGSHVRLVSDHFQLGLTGVYTKYSGNIAPYSQLYRRFEPTAHEFFVAGFDYQYMISNIIGFGEFSQRMDGGSAFLNGAIVSLDPRFDISVLHRHFDPAYVSPRSNAVGEASRTLNEDGFLLGMSAKLGGKWVLNGYYDLFSFPWLRFQADAPTKGSEYLAQLEYKPNRKFTAYVRYRFEDKQESIDLGLQPTDEIGLRQRQWYRLNWQLMLNKTVTLRSRVEYVTVAVPERETYTGFLVYQDVVFKPLWPAKYELKLRYALFDTENYDSRIYAYEHDVLYSFSVPAYYYRGSRAYVIVGYNLNKWSDLSVRVAQTFYANRTSNGSGLDEIDGPSRTEVKAQLRVKF